jgi:hypothetical protein
VPPHGSDTAPAQEDHAPNKAEASAPLQGGAPDGRVAPPMGGPP